jgi:hypothetical protein
VKAATVNGNGVSVFVVEAAAVKINNEGMEFFLKTA